MNAAMLFSLRPAVRDTRAPEMAKSKIKPKRSLASRKRAKNVDGAREGVAFTKGLPEPLRPEVEGCMSRKLRDLLRRVGSLNPKKAEEVRLQREQRRVAAIEARANSESKPTLSNKRKHGSALSAPADQQQAASNRPLKRPRDGSAPPLRAVPAKPAESKQRARPELAARRDSARPPTAFKSGGRVKFGETNAAPPDLAFSQRLLKKAAAHSGAAAAQAARAIEPTAAAARERERVRALAIERERVIAAYRASRGPHQMQQVPAFVERSIA